MFPVPVVLAGVAGVAAAKRVQLLIALLHHRVKLLRRASCRLKLANDQTIGLDFSPAIFLEVRQRLVVLCLLT